MVGVAVVVLMFLILPERVTVGYDCEPCGGTVSAEPTKEGATTPVVCLNRIFPVARWKSSSRSEADEPIRREKSKRKGVETVQSIFVRQIVVANNSHSDLRRLCKS